MTHSRYYLRALALLLAVAALIRAWLAWYGSMSYFGQADQFIYRLPDDAFYYFAIAKQIALGHGITIDGIHPTNGMHPLWLAIVTPIFWLIGPNASPQQFSIAGDYRTAVQAVVWLQSALDLLVVWLIADTIRTLLPNAEERNRSSAALISAMLYALSPLVLLRSINGLETTVTSLCILLWLRQAIRVAHTLRVAQASRLRSTHVAYRLRPTWTWPCFGLITGLLFLARTDMFLLILPATAYIAIALRRELPAAKIAIAASIAALLVAPWLWWNWITFGSLLQSSAQAVPFFAMKKYDVIYGPTAKYFYLALESLRTALKPFVLTTYGLSLATLAFAWIKRRKSNRAAALTDSNAAAISTHERDTLMLVLAMIFGSILLLVFHSFMRGFIREWYVMQLLPLFFVAFGYSIARNAGTRTVRLSGRYTLALVLLVPHLLQQQVPAYRSQLVTYFARNTLNPRIFNEHKVASLNSGYYAFASSDPTKVVNLDGVVNPLALEHIKSGTLHQYLRDDSVDYIFEFEGDLGGYINLIDRHLLDGFVLDTSMQLAKQVSPVLLYRRATVEKVRLK